MDSSFSRRPPGALTRPAPCPLSLWINKTEDSLNKYTSVPCCGLQFGGNAIFLFTLKLCVPRVRPDVGQYGIFDAAYDAVPDQVHFVCFDRSTAEIYEGLLSGYRFSRASRSSSTNESDSGFSSQTNSLRCSLSSRPCHTFW